VHQPHIWAHSGRLLWSATTRSDFTPNAWGVNFDGGGLLNLGKTEFHYVRAVRYGS